MVKDGVVNVVGRGCSDAAAEEGLFGHVNDVANSAAEGWIRIREELVGFAVGDGVAGPGAEESCERGVSAKHQDVDVEFVTEEVFEVWRGVNG